MPDMLSIPRGEWENLEKRAKKLAGEKSYLQLLVNMMQQLGAVAGLENVVEAMPRIVMENIGGTNLVLYYFIDQDIYRVDLYGNKAQLDAFDDPDVAQVAASREMVEIEHDFSATRMLAEEYARHGWTWIFPLMVGPDLIGVFKLENLHISTREWRQQLPTFFNYAALVLKNEILGHTRLQKAYAKLEKEISARLVAEDELEIANDELQLANDELQLKLDTLLQADVAIEEIELRNILNIPELKSLLEDVYEISHVASAILDLKGEVLIGIGWQTICTQFHRVHSQTRQNCYESDVVLTRGIPEGQVKAYKCKNNLWDVSTPLFLGGRHVANLFIGQFFYEDEPPDEAVFSAQADKYGFDKDAYLEAMRQVPLCSRETVAHLMAFYGKFAALVSKLSFSNVKLARSLLDNKRIGEELRRAKEGLEETVAERTAALQRTTDELDRFFTLNLDLLCIAGMDGCFHRLNRAWEKTLGYSLDELRLARFTDFIHPDDVAPTGDAVAKLAAGEEVIGFVNRYRCKDGSYRWIEWHSTKGNDLIYAAARDITERKQAEEQLRNERDFAEGLVNTAPAIVLVLDAEGRIVRINPFMETVSGYTLAEVQGKDWFSTFLPEGRREQVRSMFLSAINDIQTRGNVDTIVTRDGRERFIEWNDKTLKDAEGRTLGLLAIGQDITSRREAEEKLRILNETLENRVQEEVAKNREKDTLLIQQSRLATMGEMMHNVAHQWRQPLSAITLLLQNILDEYDYGELTRDSLSEEVKTARRLADKMSTTIDDFRNFFRPDQRSTVFNLRNSVREALNLVEASFNNNQITVTVAASEDVLVTGFANEFSQVLLNVLTNAKDAILKAGVGGQVAITVERKDGTGVVRVRDNGGGIPEDVLPKVFDPYFTTKESGTGIGLYMSRMIMEHMHATIEIRNVDGGAEVVLGLAEAEQ